MLAKPYFCESNILTLLPEALTADIQAVFSNKTGFVCADAAVSFPIISTLLQSSPPAPR